MNDIAGLLYDHKTTNKMLALEINNTFGIDEHDLLGILPELHDHETTNETLALVMNTIFGNNIDDHDLFGILPELYLLGVIINSLVISIKASGGNNTIVQKKTSVINGVISKIQENLNVLLFA